jgi:hypothetical protein
VVIPEGKGGWEWTFFVLELWEVLETFQSSSGDG